MRTSSIVEIYFNAVPDVFIKLSIERDFDRLGDVESCISPVRWIDDIDIDGSKCENLW